MKNKMVGKRMTLTAWIIIFSMSIFSILASPLSPQSIQGNSITRDLKTDTAGAVAGRFVSVPVKVYKQTFKDTLQLGQCPLAMEENSIKRCYDEFEGEVVHLAKGATTVDVSKVQTSEDIFTHYMGGIGVSVGVLGLISVNPKVNVAVDTDTKKNSLNLMSSYEISRGVMTLHQPRVKAIKGDSALFLSEIELGGNELLLVTLGFESEDKKTQVDVTITVKILWWSFSKKLTYIKENLNVKASCRIQFKSSWREEKDIYFSTIDNCISKVEEIENMYLDGPQQLKALSLDDERLHNMYHFSSWKASPYGSQFNLALINHDLEFLTEQNMEIKTVIQQINQLNRQVLSGDIREKMKELNATLTVKTEKLTSGLNNYHQLTLSDRLLLRDIYGHSKAPQYYQRYLERIMVPKVNI